MRNIKQLLIHTSRCTNPLKPITTYCYITTKINYNFTVKSDKSIVSKYLHKYIGKYPIKCNITSFIVSIYHNIISYDTAYLCFCVQKTSIFL